MNIQDFASKLFGSTRIEESGDLSNRVDSITAAGATASEAGAVGVTLDAEITPADDSSETDETIIEMPTSPSVDVGDDVIIGLTGEGPLKVPVVLANPGSGDRVASQAQQAIDIAEATGQHFWDADDGAHVTEVTREEWEDSTSPNYHSGPNSLWNSLGMLFRDGLTNLLAILTNGLAIYDGQGNAQSNVVASFSGESVVLGKDSARHVDIRQNDDASTGSKAGLNFYSGPVLDLSFNERGICWWNGYLGGVTLSLYNILDEIKTDRQGMHLYAYSAPAEAIQYARIDLLATENAVSGSGTVKLTGGNLALSNQAGTSTTSMTMEKAIDMLTTSTGTITKESAVTSIGSSALRKAGKVVSVIINDVKLASALASGTTLKIATIPAGYRPGATARTAALVDTAGNFGNIWGVVGTGGNVLIANRSPTSIPTTKTISFCLVYIVT